MTSPQLRASRRRSRASARAAEPRPLLRAIRLLFSLLSLFLAVHLSGAVHAVVDLLSGHDQPAQLAGCLDEDEGRDCPPGCPSCHCAHGVGALPPRGVEAPSRRPRAVAAPRFFVRARGGPKNPALASLFRPPRGLA